MFKRPAEKKNEQNKTKQKQHVCGLFVEVEWILCTW